MKKLLLITAAICKIFFCLTVAHAQLYISNADFVTRSGALVFVSKDVEYAGNASRTVDHNGLLELQGNWYNTSDNDTLVFTPASSGVVIFGGGLQSFNGYNTRFPNLTLAGTAKKIQNTNIEVAMLLDLTSKELDVNGHVARILWNDADAIQFLEGGYINTSTITNPQTGTTSFYGANRGWLMRSMDNVSSYVFPLGNNNEINGFRFRPLVMKAKSPGAFYGQFQNYAPDIDSYPAAIASDSIEDVNRSWYHAIFSTSNTSQLDVGLPFNSVTDGDYSTIAEWQQLTTPRGWRKVMSVGPSSPSGYNTTNTLLATAFPVLLSGKNPVPLSLAKTKKAASTLFIPNVITPNGDNANDRWQLEGMDIRSKYSVVIFNRWQNVVYKNENYANSWDGKGLNAGTYFYDLRVTSPDGKIKTYRGFIMLMK